MNGTEAAASLFGPGDSLPSDPFATLGADESQERSDSTFTGVETDGSVQSTPELHNVGGQQPQSGNTTSPFHPPLAAQTYGSSDPYTPARYASGTGEVYGIRSQQADNQSHWGTHLSNNASYTPPVAHDPYVPPQGSTYGTPSNYQPPPTQASTLAYPGNTVSSYDPHNGYSPSQLTNPSDYPAYSAYVSTTASGMPTVPASPYSSSQSSSYASPTHPPPKAALATVPSPPVPSTTQVTRPKISNAYDPPFPVASYSRRNVSGPAKLGQVPITSPYATYQSTPPPPSVPPPPRSPRYTPRHTQVSDYSPSHAPAPAPHPGWTGEANTSSALSHNHRHDSDTSPQWLQSERVSPPPQQTSTQPGHQLSGSQDSIGDSIQAEASSMVDPLGMSDTQGDAIDFEAVIPAPPSEIQPSPATLITQPLRSPASISSASPSVHHAHVSSSSTFVTAGPEGGFGVVPSSSSRSSLGHTDSPHQSPRPSSASSPGYALPQSLRRSPELHRGSVTHHDYAPRARTTSPGVDGYANITNPYAPARSSISKSKSASVTYLDQLYSPGFPSTTVPGQGAPRNARLPNAYSPERTRSPSTVSVHSPDHRQNIKPQLPSYLPPVSESLPQQEPRPAQGYSHSQSQHKYTIPPSSSAGQEQVVYGYTPELSPPSEAIARPTITPYAPSPSLMGANDPLGRTSVRVPVVSFGFGGKLVLCFHNESTLSTGFDVALSSRTSTKVQLRNWSKQIPESAQDSAVGFPGPLHADPGPPSTGIMKATSSTQAKTKKVQLVKYLADRIEEINQGLNYQHSGSVEKRMAEGKLILVKLLKIMVENDGRLLGTPQLDSAARSALLPRLEGVLSSSDSGSGFTLAADATTMFSESSYASTGVDAAPISVTTVRASALDKIEGFLLRGERRQACHYALDEKLWAHAMLIASSIDKEAWKEAVNEFIRAELGVKGEMGFAPHGRNDTPATNGRESLRMAYSLFSGQGAAAAQELVPRSGLTKAGSSLPVAVSNISTPSLPQFTPRTPNFAVPMVGTKMPVECLSKWTESAAMMILSPLTNDASAALTALGDQLMTNGWLEAAHVCYLLSLQTAPLGGVGNPTARIVLLGSKSPATCATFWRDSDSIILTEILEYALAMVPVPKGQEPNHGIPHFQAYRLLRAVTAAEAGDLNLASRYCEAITASLVRGSAYYTPVMLEELKGLADRLSGVSHSDKASSWMAGKISKPSLDTIGGWLEGRFTKLVTGDSDSPSSPQEDAGKTDMRSYTGPFTHYNTISSATSSARSSPAPGFVPTTYHTSPLSDPTAANKVSYGYGTDKPPSVGDSARKNSPGPTPPPAWAPTAPISSYPSIQTELSNSNSNGYSNGYSPGSDLQTPKPPHGDKDDEANVQEVTWWGSSSYGDVGRTPTAAQFVQAGEGYGTTDSSGYFSPMANQTFAARPPSTPSRQMSSYQHDEDDDLGLGNNARKKKEEATPGDGEDAKSNQAPVPEKKKEATQPTQTPSSGWFSRWWKRDNPSGGGPVKASLGEESSFYYDKDQKRWVNKKAGEEAAKPTPPPPPPPRAQTASPAMSGPKPPGTGANGMANENGFDMRPASAVDLTSPPNSKGGMRVRSSLAPPGLDSAPPTPTGSRMALSNGSTPPPGRPRSQASQKKNVRSRYVDVFAQDAGV